MKILILVVLSLSLLCTELSAQEAPSLVINTKGAQPSVNGATDYFTGVVRVDAPFKGAEGARVSGATVTFEPSARTAWHSHPLGQTLVITSGAGFVQESGHAARSIKPGDTVWIPPNVKHWHGANATTHMTHIAISEVLDGNVVNWMEKVSDAQYAEAYSGI
jgi:quercetin dioxygenase-like cupin family protein